jgi:hypothetical protein
MSYCPDTTNIASGNRLGILSWAGTTNFPSSNSINSAAISVYATENYTNSLGSEFRFEATKLGVVGRSEVMRINPAVVTVYTNLTANGQISAGSYDNATTPLDLLPLVVNNTCTINRAYGNALSLDQTGVVYFTTSIDTNLDSTFVLNIRTNGATWGFVAGNMTNTATITSGWNSIIFHRGYRNGTGVFKGVSGQ